MARRLKGELVKVRSVERQHNQRLKLPPHVGVFDSSPVRRSLAAIR
jgi:hypothetical protein